MTSSATSGAQSSNRKLPLHVQQCQKKQSGELYFDLVLFTARRISVGDVLLGLDPYE